MAGEGEGAADAAVAHAIDGGAGYHGAADAHLPHTMPDARSWRSHPDAEPSEPDAATCSPTGETCEPGAMRYCDGNRYCNWGVQMCGPDHAWGVCDETSQAPAGCSPPSYNETCCVDHGYCCQGSAGASSGVCPGVTPACHHHD
jgi:hypothetical protein